MNSNTKISIRFLIAVKFVLFWTKRTTDVLFGIIDIITLNYGQTKYNQAI